EAPHGMEPKFSKNLQEVHSRATAADRQSATAEQTAATRRPLSDGRYSQCRLLARSRGFEVGRGQPETRFGFTGRGDVYLLDHFHRATVGKVGDLPGACVQLAVRDSPVGMPANKLVIAGRHLRQREPAGAVGPCVVRMLGNK